MSEREIKTPAPDSIKGSHLTALPYYTNFSCPQRFSDYSEVKALFNEILMHNASDIIISPDCPITLQIKGKGLFAISHFCLDLQACKSLINLIVNDETIFQTISQKEAVSGATQIIADEKSAFKTTMNIASSIKGNEKTLDVDVSTGGNRRYMRFRYQLDGCLSKTQANGFTFIMRPLTDAPLPYDKLKIEHEYVQSCIHKDGIVIIAGATGQGKTTTIASIIRYLLENDTLLKGIFLTLEDPIEIRYDSIESTHSQVYQTQVAYGGHISSFAEGNRSAMRRSPVLLLMGELRDEDTIMSAVELSLTGHTVFATTHSTNVAAILPRLISRFPPNLQTQKAADMLDTLRLLSAQRLIWLKDGSRLSVREWLVLTSALRSELYRYINDPQTLFSKIKSIMDNELFGAVSFKSQAERLLAEDKIDEYAYRYLCDDTDVMSDEDKNILHSL